MKKALIEFLEDLPSLGALIRANRMWRKRELVSTIEHDQILALVTDDGRMTSRYSFMVTMSCAIAILGLLLSSPAVIIGAMLISPLMGPIMSLGFSLCIIEFKQMKKALEAILIGIFLALAISGLIVYLSPLTDPTPEIMARTQPNLFDLLVAIFSGLAGGYATIRQKGATIVGVAIATALMPPLAVVGYGLATANWHIAQGAFFLFMTNLLAISLSVTLIAKLYGFGAHNAPKTTLLQTSLVFIAFGLMSIPLGLSLSKIAYQSYVTKTVKNEISAYYENANSRVNNFSITFSKNNPISVDCVLVTDKYRAKAESDIKSKIEKEIEEPLSFSLDQIIVTKSEQEKIINQETIIPTTTLTNATQSKLLATSPEEDITSSIKNAVFFPMQFIKTEANTKKIFIYPESTDKFDIKTYREFEKSLVQKFPDWNIFVIPPAQALPYVFFDIGKSVLSPQETEKLDTILWALQRWNISDIFVAGFASSYTGQKPFNNNSLALKRANTVKNYFESQGIKASAKSDYLTFDQKMQERDNGINNLQRVEVRLGQIQK